MSVREPIVFIIALLFSLGSAQAQQSDSAAVRAAFDSVVTANTYTATLEDGWLTGPGDE